MFPSTASSSSQMFSGFSAFATRSMTASSFSPVTPFGTSSSTTSLAGGSFGTPPSGFMQGNQQGNLFTPNSTWTGFQTSSPLPNTQTTVTFGTPSSNVHGTSTSGGSLATKSTFNTGGFNSTSPSLFPFTSSWPTNSISTTPVKPNPFAVPTTSISTTPVKPNPFGVPTPSVATETATWKFPSPTQTSTWKYPGPTSTSFPSQPIFFSSSANTSLTNATSAPSNSFNPFAPRTNFTTPASTVSSVSLAPSNHNPFTSFNSLATQSFPSPASSTLNPGQTNTPPWNAFWSTPVDKPSNSLVTTAATSVSDSHPPLNHNPNTNPSNSFNPFAPRTNLTSPASSSSPSFTTWTSAQASTPSWSPIISGPFVSTTTAAANSVSVLNPPSNHNPDTNCFTSQATHPSSSSSSPTFAAWTPAQASTPSSFNAFLTTPKSGPSTTTAANSVSVSHVISGLSSNFHQPTALINPYVSSTQNCNGEITGITGQISSSQISSMEQPSPAASPFGILPPKPQLFFEDSRPIQIGISSIPVKDKPAAVRYQVLTTRHLSRNKLPIRKYDPKLNAPKIPFFNDTKEIPVDIFFPRENPRKLVISPVSWSPKASTVKNIGEEKKSSDGLYENKKEDSKAYNCSDDPTTEQELFATILEVPTKLQLPDYYTKPQISDLEAKERVEPGFCRRVKDFVVGRHGYGSIKFLGETDVRKLDIESLIQFNNREVIVYMDETKKPAVGEGLNKAAEITLLNIKCVDKKTGMQYKDGSKMNKYVEMLKKKSGAEFMSYDPVEGEWKFRVQHF